MGDFLTKPKFFKLLFGATASEKARNHLETFAL